MPDRPSTPPHPPPAKGLDQRLMDAFVDVDFALPAPGTRGRLDQAKAIGAAAARAWLSAADASAPETDRVRRLPYRYPPPVAAWPATLQVAWFDAYVETYLAETRPETVDDREDPQGALLQRLLPAEGDAERPTLVPFYGENGAISSLRPLDARWVGDMRRALARWFADLADPDSGAFRPNTRVALLGDLRAWHRFCLVHDVAPLPAEHEALEAFVWAMADPFTGLGKKRTTLMRHLASIGRLHRAVGLPNPVTTERMKLLLSL